MAHSRKDDRVIIHFDYDCFYASVYENENPQLKTLPLVIQQKQIAVTANYVARERGVHKLQLISDAKKACPDVIIILGEDLTKFRDASKELYKFIETFSWNRKVERLGFDEVFMDISDIVEYNLGLLNLSFLDNPDNVGNDELEHLRESFFQLKKDDPMIGFKFDATVIAGHVYPDSLDSDLPYSSPHSRIITAKLFGSEDTEPEHRRLLLRLILGSHLAQHIRTKLQTEKGYTSTVGISTTKLISKLAGNIHKPAAQTTLLPPYQSNSRNKNDGSGGEEAVKESNITTFLDAHDIGKIPGIGFKTAQAIRNHVLARPAAFDSGLVYGGTKENVTVRDVRLFPGMGPSLLQKLLGSKAGAEREIGKKIWDLINGIDNSEVKDAKNIPSQISIEDSYLRLEELGNVVNELRVLVRSLVRRMWVDLVDDANEEGNQEEDVDTAENDISKNSTGISSGSGSDIQTKPLPTQKPKPHWLAHPKTIRLSTCPRLPLNPDGTRTRSFKRISRSAPLPSYVFNLLPSSHVDSKDLDALVERLVQETLLPMFRKLHPDKSGWNLSLINVCVTNMIEMGGSGNGRGTAGGRDIASMFRNQESVLKEWRVADRDVPPDGSGNKEEGDVLGEMDGMNGMTDTNETNEMTLTKETNPVKAEPSAGNEAINTKFEGSEDMLTPTQESSDADDQNATWEDEEYEGDDDSNPSSNSRCPICGVYLPVFAVPAHERWHGMG